MSGISLETYELVMEWEKVVRRLAEHRRNGHPLPERWTRAISELIAAACVATVPGDADVTTLDMSPPAPSRLVEIDVKAASVLLGIRPGAVRKRIAAGKLNARKVAGVWLVEWQEQEESRSA